MSAQLLAESTFTICRAPDQRWSWKWWYFKEMCLVLGL